MLHKQKTLWSRQSRLEQRPTIIRVLQLWLVRAPYFGAGGDADIQYRSVACCKFVDAYAVWVALVVLLYNGLLANRRSITEFGVITDKTKWVLELGACLKPLFKPDSFPS